MSIRFPKGCRTRGERSAHARYVARVGWERRKMGEGPVERWVGCIVFGGPLAGGGVMRLDLVAREGRAKWEGYSDGERMGKGLSERGVLRIVRGVLRARAMGMKGERDAGCGDEEGCRWRGEGVAKSARVAGEETMEGVTRFARHAGVAGGAMIARTETGEGDGR